MFIASSQIAQKSVQRLLFRISFFVASDNTTQAPASAAMPSQRFLKTATLDAEAEIMAASAFDTARNVLRRSGNLAAANRAIMTRQVLAKHIIAMGWTGERDQERLVKGAFVHVASREMISRGVSRQRTNA